MAAYFCCLGFLALIALLLQAIVLISTSNNNDVLSKLNWSHAHQKSCDNNCVSSYVGFWSFLTKSDLFDDSKVKWNSDTCSNVFDFCEDCEEAMKVVLAFVIISAFCTMQVILSNFYRASESGNSAKQKCLGLFFSVIATCCGLISIIVFARGCQRHVYDDTKDQLDWWYGSAWIIMVVVTVINALSAVANFFLYSKFQ